MIALVNSFGLLGGVLAPILVVSLQVLFKNLLPVYTSSENESAENSLDSLRSRLGDIRQMAGSPQEDGAAESANLVDRMEKLLEKAKQFDSAD
jgi:predicted PurR-regulated permease PerM